MAEDSALDTREEATASPAIELRRWLLEIRLAKKREKKWRKKAEKVIRRYRGTEGDDDTARKNSFNILWSNTEVLRPALYNSTPKPDVRRRFRQSDMLGKAVGEVMERSLTYCVDAYDLDNCLQNSTLDALLPGRGIDRIRYVPKFKQIPKPKEENESPHEEEPFEGTREEVEYEQALCDHVQWDDFLHGPGKVWEEVQWVAFKQRPTRDDLIEQFGEEIGKKITLDDVDDDELREGPHLDLKEAFKRATLWEVWDKEGEQVFFVSETYRDGVIYAKAPEGVELAKGEPPLKLKNFFPIPRPLQLVEDTGSLLPIPLYELYRQQAEELDRLSARINRIINACRVRFVHDSSLSELKALMDAGDNEGIPSENARAWLTNGGIEKAIWWMPVDKVAAVLKELYIARDGAKQVIYEITGISDILRGATDPNETLGAQKLKANSSSLRLQRMQREVQRYTRDLIRLLAEVIGEHFSEQTLSQMTGLQFPTQAQKQMMQVQMQAMQQQPQPPPQMQAMQNALQMPSWEDIMGVLRSDMQREYRVDVETDSTVAQSLSQDMEGLKEVIGGIVEFWQGVGPAVQAGAVSIEAVKAITMTIARRARMGLEVEDALENGLKEPQQQGDPKAQAEQQKQKLAEVQAQHQAQLDQQQQAHDQAIAQRQQKHEEQIAQREDAHQQALAASQARLEEQAKGIEDATKRYQIDADNRTKIEVAEISAGATLDAAEIKAANAGVEGDASGAESSTQAVGNKTKRPPRQGMMDRLAQMHSQTLDAHGKAMSQLGEHIGNLAKSVAAPRKAVRDPVSGRITHSVTETVQ